MGFESRDATVVQFVLELLRQHRISDATFDAMREMIGNSGVVDLLVVTGYYHTLAHALQALEVELPFLQAVALGCEIVPVVVGRLAAGDVGPAAAAITDLCDETTLTVVSSDFTHYGRSSTMYRFPRQRRVNRSKRSTAAPSSSLWLAMGRVLGAT